MKKGLLALVFIYQAMLSFGSTCIGPVNFTSQSQINSFSVCDTITGFLTIGPNGMGDEITDLSPLKGIKVVVLGISIIDAPELLTLNGLETLDTTWVLQIMGNPKLVDINALNGMGIGSGLVVRNNTNLSQCCVFKDMLSSIPMVDIPKGSNNATGCAEVDEILADTSCEPTGVPTLTEWVIIQLSLLMMIIGVLCITNESHTQEQYSPLKQFLT